MKKRSFTTVSRFLLAITLVIAFALSGCTTGNTDPTQKPTEEPTARPTEVVTPTEDVTPTATEDPTQSPTEGPTATADQPEGDIIPLYRDNVTAEMVSMVDPIEFLDFDKYSAYFSLNPVNVEANMDGTIQLYTLDYGDSFEVREAPIMNNNNCYTMTLYIARNVEGVPDVGNNEIGMYYQVDGNADVKWFAVPICYNQAKGCFVGYSVNTEEGTFHVAEWYYSQNGTFAVAPVSDADYYTTYRAYF